MFDYPAVSMNQGDTTPGGSARLTSGAVLRRARSRRASQGSICLGMLPITEETEKSAGCAGFLHFHIFPV